jgi:succinate dehydrogenase / fumarate reductase membrane anchor subunit
VKPAWEHRLTVFMRLSGVLLAVLVLGYLYQTDLAGGGVQRLGFAWVAARWSNPLWQAWDAVTLWLALLHGANGLRIIVRDYASRPRFLYGLVGVLTVAALVVGTYTIVAFNPLLTT